MEVNLKNYFCEHPFIYSEFHKEYNPKDGLMYTTQFLCCPDWNDVNIHVSDNLLENWESEPARKVREGILNGDFSHCSPINCPHFNTLINTGKLSGKGGIRLIEEFNSDEHILKGPRRIKVCSDDACNFHCPTCRTEVYQNSPEKTIRTKKLLDSITEHYGGTLKEIYLSGGGEPFYSIPIREFLTNIKKEDFPVLNGVILHTNASLWTENLWNKMATIHPYLKMVEISIDAATKDTYENKTRLGGNWDVLMKNLSFISNIETIETIIFSFVVQQNNFREMEQFVLLIDKLFKHTKINTVIQFQRVLQWPSISDERYKDMKIWEPSNPDYHEFLIELEKIKSYGNIMHNLNDHNLDEKKLI
jgi:wyosine [tRNA(Phe)-imidazoG37] synthetase (radical SAM superfamily)